MGGTETYLGSEPQLLAIEIDYNQVPMHILQSSAGTSRDGADVRRSEGSTPGRCKHCRVARIVYAEILVALFPDEARQESCSQDGGFSCVAACMPDGVESRLSRVVWSSHAPKALTFLSCAVAGALATGL